MRRSHLFDFSAIGKSFDFQQGLPKTWNPESGICLLHLSKYHQSYTSLATSSSERMKIPYSQANHHMVSYTEKEKKKEKKFFSDLRIPCIRF